MRRAPEPAVIELWLWPLTRHGDAAQLSGLLSPDEQARAARFVQAKHGQEFTVARGCLRQILASYLGQDAAAISFRYGSHGRPALAQGCGLEFSLSHSGGYAALAVAENLTIGLDIEQLRDIEPEVPALFFSEAERAELSRLAGAGWRSGFFNAWTRKEAVIKALGLGLSMPLDSFDVSLTPGQPARLHRIDGAQASDWRLFDLAPLPGVAGALAVSGATKPLRLIPRDGWPLAALPGNRHPAAGRYLADQLAEGHR